MDAGKQVCLDILKRSPLCSPASSELFLLQPLLIVLVFTYCYSRLLALIVLLVSGNVQRRIGDRQADKQDDIVKQASK